VSLNSVKKEVTGKSKNSSTLILILAATNQWDNSTRWWGQSYTSW